MTTADHLSQTSSFFPSNKEDIFWIFWELLENSGSFIFRHNPCSHGYMTPSLTVTRVGRSPSWHYSLSPCACLLLFWFIWQGQGRVWSCQFLIHQCSREMSGPKWGDLSRIQDAWKIRGGKRCCWLMLERQYLCNRVFEQLVLQPQISKTLSCWLHLRGRPASTLWTASWCSAASALMKLCHHFRGADVPDWWGKQALFVSCKCHYNRTQ